MLLTQGFTRPSKAAFPRRLWLQNRDSTGGNLVNTLKWRCRVKTTILADKGYDSRKFRKFAFNHGIYPRIPKRSYTTEGKDPYRNHMYRYDKEEAKFRFIVERTNAWFKSFRRLRNRFDYHAASFESWLYLAIIIVCVRRLVLWRIIDEKPKWFYRSMVRLLQQVQCHV